MPDKIFFQSSLPRSGSTLFQNIMAQNPEFYVTPTSGVLELLYAARGNYTNSPEFRAQDAKLMEDGWRSFCREGMMGFFNGVTDKKYVLDKSRGWGIHYNFLNFFYTDPKIVCLLRDPVDIFCSLEKKFRANQHKDAGIVNSSLMQGTTTEKRIDIWAGSQPVGLAFDRLRQMVREDIDKKILFVRYEKLSNNPDKEMKRVYDFFDLPFYQHNFANIEQVTKEDDEVYGIFGDHAIKPKLMPSKSDAREVLGKAAYEWIKTNYAWVDSIQAY
jgi:sulfotransferase